MLSVAVNVGLWLILSMVIGITHNQDIKILTQHNKRKSRSTRGRQQKDVKLILFHRTVLRASLQASKNPPSLSVSKKYC